MKRLIVIAAAFAAFAACSKLENSDFQDSNDGKMVMLRVNAEQDTSTRVNGALNGEGKIAFTWESTDKIKVTRGGESAEFTYVSGAGTGSATFQGVMPGTEGAFDVQFPSTDTDLPLTQDYVENGLPHNLMKAVATGCTQTDNITLTPVYSALRLNIFTDANPSISIGRIVVTTLDDSEKVYTLNFSSAVSLGTTSSAATPFFFVIPACTTRIKVDLYDTPSATVMCNTFLTTTAQVFNAGKVRNMPAKRMSIQYFDNGTDYGEAIYLAGHWWAPVNCGYSSSTESGDCTMGRYYQWGRRTGLPCAEGVATKTSSDSFTGKNGEEDPNTFYSYGSTAFYHDWISEGSNYYWNGDTKGQFDPCPDGWRVSAYSELRALLSPNDASNYQLIYESTRLLLRYKDTSKSISLPYAGWIGVNPYDNQKQNDRGTTGRYWTSNSSDKGQKTSVTGNAWWVDAWFVEFKNGYLNLDNWNGVYYNRYHACPVRCVRE